MNKDDYSIKELLEAVGDNFSLEENSDASQSLHQVGGFIEEFAVTSGPDRIPNFIIYYFYKEKYNGELSKIEFFRQFKKEFKQVRTGKQRCYLLDGKSFTLTREDMIEAKFHDKKEKDKKGSGRVSRPKRKD